MRSPASCQTSHDVTAFGVTHLHGTHSRALASRFLVFFLCSFKLYLVTKRIYSHVETQLPEFLRRSRCWGSHVLSLPGPP